ncbi:MAG TPA: hypothetical protein VGD59_02205 [Acidisarcina sp.]
MTTTMWKCEQMRAGKVYNKMLFNTQAEAEQFAAQLRRAEPDLMYRVEPVPAWMEWN